VDPQIVAAAARTLAFVQSLSFSREEFMSPLKKGVNGLTISF
jgi:hypothetical protein